MNAIESRSERKKKKKRGIRYFYLQLEIEAFWPVGEEKSRPSPYFSTFDKKKKKNQTKCDISLDACTEKKKKKETKIEIFSWYIVKLLVLKVRNVNVTS